MDPLLFWTYWCCRVCGPPLWQRSVREELLAATTAGRTSVTGLMKIVRPPGAQMLTNHRGNWEHKKVCYHLLSNPALLELQMLVTYARTTRKVHGTCVSNQVLPLRAIQVHAKPALAAHPGNLNRNDLLSNLSINLAGTCAILCLYLTPPCKVWVRDSQCPVPAQGVQGESTGPKRELIQVVQVVQVPGMKGPMGHLWVAYGSPMGRLWVAYGSPMGRLWVTYGSPMGRLWVAYGSPMGHLWVAYGSPMGRLWVAYGSPMGRLWV